MNKTILFIFAVGCLLAAPRFEAFGQANEKITFECPRDVRVGFKSPPADWQEGWGAGVGLSVPFFEAAVLEGKTPTITCVYRQDLMFTLIRAVPSGYKCVSQEKAGGRNRFVTCTRIKPPIKLPKNKK